MYYSNAGAVLAKTTQGSAEDVDAAVKAASKAYTSWSNLSPHARARYLYRYESSIYKDLLLKLIAVIGANEEIMTTLDS